MTLKDVFTGEPIPAIRTTREGVIEDARKKIKDGYEISWFTTDVSSYEWAEVNADIERFFNTVLFTGFKEVYIGYFNHETKDTIYEAYEVIEK